MLTVRFLKGCQVGTRFYSPGVVAGIPDNNVPDLLARGFAERIVSAAPEPAPAPSAVEARVTKPAPTGMSKSALKRLLRMQGA